MKEKLLKILDKCENNNDVRNLLYYLFELDQDSIKNERDVALKYGLDSDECVAAHDNTMRLNKEYINIIEEIIKKFGWLSANEIGKIANQTMWIIVQHSDLETQQRFYPIMKEECAKGNVSREHLAKLIDRMLVSEGKEQIYGTQFKTNSDFSCELYPIENIEEVDLRRSEVGLMSLQDELDIMMKNTQSKMNR